MKLTLESFQDGIIRLQCENEITQADFLVEGNPLTTLLGPLCFQNKVLVGLEKTTFIDSAGIGWLVMAHKHFREGGGLLVLHSVPPLVDKVFRLLKMPTVLNLAQDETAALALVGGGKP